MDDKKTVKMGSEDAGSRYGEDAGSRYGEDAGSRYGEDAGSRYGEDAGSRYGEDAYSTHGGGGAGRGDEQATVAAPAGGSPFVRAGRRLPLRPPAAGGPTHAPAGRRRLGARRMVVAARLCAGRGRPARGRDDATVSAPHGGLCLAGGHGRP